MPWSALGSAISGIGSLISGNQQQKAQERENEKNRQFNSLEAQKNRDFQQQQTLQQMEYSSPKAQIQRLKDAGLNPALAYGNADTGIVTPQSGSQASSTSTSVGGESLRAAGFQQLGNSMLQAAQINALNTQTEGEELDNRSKEIDLAWKSIEKSQEFEYKGVLISVAKSEEEVNKARVDEIMTNIDETLQNIENLKKQYEVTELNRELLDIEATIKSATMNVTIQNIIDHARIDYQTAQFAARQCLATLNYTLAQGDLASYNGKLVATQYADLQERFNRAIQTRKLKVGDEEVELNEYDLEFLKSWQCLVNDFYGALNSQYKSSAPFLITQDFLDMAGQVIGMYTDVKGANKPAPQTTHHHTHNTPTTHTHHTTIYN